MNTVLFATCYVGKPEYLDRYRKYLSYYLPKLKKLGAEKIFLIDDGSPLEILAKLNVPVIELEKLRRGQYPALSEPVYIFRFPDKFGRHAGILIPGWWRSFSFSGWLAQMYGIKKLIHLESDTFILSDKMFEFIKNENEGWSVPYCRQERYPETCIQIINEKSSYKYYEPDRPKENFKLLVNYFRRGEAFFFKSNVGDFNYIPGLTLPFDRIIRDFKGDRYGEDYWAQIPDDIDYMANINDISQSWKFKKLKSKQPTIKRLLKLKEPEGNCITGFHSGDMGDVIYAIPVMKRLGITKLYLNPQPWYGTKLGLSQINILKQLLKSAGLDIVVPEPNERIYVDYDMDMARNIGQNYDTQHLAVIQANPFIEFSENDISEPWLNVSKNHIADIIISRSARYHLPAMNWKSLLDDLHATICFVGLESEYEAFLKDTGLSVELINYQPTLDFLDLAKIIAGAKLFIGNQSSPYAIAEGLKVPRIQETCEFCKNCLPVGENGFSIQSKKDLKKAKQFIQKILGS